MATYYWVGGTGTWNNASNTNWALSTGGAGGAGIPNSADNVIFDANSGAAATVTVASTAACLACTVNKADITLSLSGSPTFAGAFTFTQGTLNLNSFNLTSLTFLGSNANARTLAFGTGSITVTGNNTVAFTMGNRTNATITGTPRVFSTYAGSVGTRTINLDNGSGAYATRIALFVTSGTDIVTTTGNSNGDLDFTGFAGTWALGSFASAYRGGLILNSTMTVDSGTNTTQTFNATGGPHQINMAGKTINAPVIFNGAGGSWRFTGPFSISTGRRLTLTNGTLDANGQNVSIGDFALGAGTKTLTIGIGTWSVLSGNFDGNTNATGLTVSAATGVISMNSASSKIFAGGARTWPTLNQGGSGALTIQQSNSFANITNTVQPATITLTSGTTQTVAAFGVSGTAGNLITLNSSTAGTRATLSDSVGTVEVSNVSIKDINATGGATWNAFLKTGNVDAGNNSGWDFFPAVRQVFGQVFSSIFRPIF
jgi:autotransporter-associated beta strand protein